MIFEVQRHDGLIKINSMSINLYNPLWKEFLKYLGWILLFVFLWFKGCSRNEESSVTTKVIVPEVKETFEAKKPVHKAIENSVVKDYLTTEKGDKVFIENPIDEKLIDENEKLKQDFAKETDSLKKVIAYNKAVQLNKFSTKFEDDNLLLNIEGVVQGEVQEIKPNYTVKKKTVEVPVKQKETVFRLLVGGAIGLNKELNQASYRLDVNFQNRKGNIISAEYLQVGTQSFGMIGFKKSLINIKR